MSGNSCDRKYEWLNRQMKEMPREFFVPYQYVSALHQRILGHFLHWYQHEDPNHRSLTRWYNEIKKDFRGELSHMSDSDLDTFIDELFAKLGCEECRNRKVYQGYRDVYAQIRERFGLNNANGSSQESISDGVKRIISGFQFSLLSTDMDISGILLVFIDALGADLADIAFPMAQSACDSLNECIRALQERSASPIAEQSIVQSTTQLPRTDLSPDEKLDLIIEMLSSHAPASISLKPKSSNGSKIKHNGKIDKASLPLWIVEYKSSCPIPEPYRSWINGLAPHIFWGRVGATRTASPSYIMKRLQVPDNATLLESWIDGTFATFVQLYEKDHGPLDPKMYKGFCTRAGELHDLFSPRSEYILGALDSHIRERDNSFTPLVLSNTPSS